MKIQQINMVFKNIGAFQIRRRWFFISRRPIREQRHDQCVGRS
ncbi:MAG: hypothetical protein RBT80_23455 [Candidatus Vecturithrix sp.]|nr:hypothetical protein [Candidatus Vecturithrix sp.]